MTEAHQGTLYIFSAPSGAGKSSLAKALVESGNDTVLSVSHTTREPRPGEENGVHYHFIDKVGFEAKIAAGDFIEYAKVFDNFYGTSRGAVETPLNKGINVILDIDWQGARAIREQIKNSVSIFILPPTRAELENRLRGRGQDSDENIARRMRDAVSEMSHYDEFDFVVVNDDFAAAQDDLRAIVSGRPEQVRPMNADIDDLLRESVEKSVQDQ
ncbi:MAG: guanylate kinase [Acidiferrobacterales bacterium]